VERLSENPADEVESVPSDTVASSVPICRVCGRPMMLDPLDKDKRRWWCDRDDTTFYPEEQRWSGTARPTPPAPPVGALDIWIPIMLLLVIVFLGFVAAPPVGVLEMTISIIWLLDVIYGRGGWWLSAIAVICTAIYVHYNSKKFGMKGNHATWTLLVAILGLPSYAYELHKLRETQKHSLIATPAAQQQAPPSQIPLPRRTESPRLSQEPRTDGLESITSAKDRPIATKICPECGATIPGDSKFCEKCGTNLTWTAGPTYSV